MIGTLRRWLQKRPGEAGQEHHGTLEAETKVMYRQAKEAWQPPEAGKGKEVFPDSLCREHNPAKTLTFGPVIPILDFWPPELWEDTYTYIFLKIVFIYF